MQIEIIKQDEDESEFPFIAYILSLNDIYYVWGESKDNKQVFEGVNLSTGKIHRLLCHALIKFKGQVILEND